MGDALALIKSHGYKIFLVSNQAVVARGMISLEEMIALNDEILALVQQQNSKAIFDDVFLCPHHPKATLEAYRIDCECRKPKAGMLKQAEKKYQLELSQSIIIGDRLSDVYAGKSVGCKGFQLLTENQTAPLIETTVTLKPEWLIPDKKFNSLIQAARYIQEHL